MHRSHRAVRWEATERGVPSHANVRKLTQSDRGWGEVRLSLRYWTHNFWTTTSRCNLSFMAVNSTTIVQAVEKYCPVWPSGLTKASLYCETIRKLICSCVLSSVEQRLESSPAVWSPLCNMKLCHHPCYYCYFIMIHLKIYKHNLKLTAIKSPPKKDAFYEIFNINLVWVIARWALTIPLHVCCVTFFFLLLSGIL